MNKLYAIEVFLKVAELNSFTQAANSMGLPKGSVSSTIQKLENHIGARLFHRTTRTVKLTHDGQVFYERCKDIVADVEELESIFQAGSSNISGRIRVDMPLGMAKNLVIPNLSRFISDYPNISIELGSTDRKVDVISEGFDCVIRVGDLADSALIARPLGQLSMINCISPDYLDKYGSPETLADLSRHYVINYAAALEMRSAGLEYFNGEKYTSLKMKSMITVNNSDSYIAACVAGLGIIQVPAIGVKHHLASNILVQALRAYPAASMKISLLYPHRRHPPKRVQVFMDWVVQLMQSYADNYI